MSIRRIYPVLILASTLPASGFVLADAWVSAPSGVTTQDTLVFSGGGMPASSTVLVSITKPDNTYDTLLAQANDRGDFQVSLTPSLPGEYFAEVWDAAGQDPEPLATFMVPVAPK